MIELRPHHLFCIRKYVGKGYSEKFCLNMSRIIKALDEGEFTLVDHKDDVCRACPNLVLGRCLTQRKVKRFDDSAMKALGIEVGKTYNVKDLKGKVDAIESNEEEFGRICPDCQWKEICHKK